MKNQNEENNELTNEWYICAIAFLTLLQAIVYYLIIHQKSFYDFLENSGTASPIFLAVATLLTHIGGLIMFYIDKRNKQRKKFRDEGRAKGKIEGIKLGKAEGIAQGKAKGITEERNKWIEWDENGRDPEKRPDKINLLNQI